MKNRMITRGWESYAVVNLRGLGPYRIDRARGEIEVMRGGKREWIKTQAYDLHLPNGQIVRYARLADAKAHVRDAIAVGAAR